MNASQFALKWIENSATEKAAAQEHFIDLCGLLGQPTPNSDPDSESYAFEKGAAKTSGGDGWADVWKRGYFGWEYKGKHKDLGAAYKQLLDYREALFNPPLLVVCDLNRFEVHTNFTNTIAVVHRFDLTELLNHPAEPLRILSAVMTNPEALRPTKTRDQLTEEAASAFAALASELRSNGYDPQRVAHFLNKVLFCLFAEDAGLLPAGVVRDLATATRNQPEVFAEQLRELFGRMSKAPGGFFGTHSIEWFNGGLFDNDDVLPMNHKQVDVVSQVARLDWSQVEPAIFGTLFERGLDPAKRSQLGAHYTDRASIERVVIPVVLTPLERDFAAMQADVRKALQGIDLKAALTGPKRAAQTRARDNARGILLKFLDRLASYRVLDPACGSGNFLYIALQALKDLERRAILWASTELGLTQEIPRVGPQVVHGIEINAYAAELARVSIWIGEIQWMISNGFAYLKNPILRPLDNIECRDAVLNLADSAHPKVAEWPESDVVVGNPPFSGSQKMRRDLGDSYVDTLRATWRGRVPGGADYVLYWFEKARSLIEAGKLERAGLLGTQGIRSGTNRQILDRIKETGDIFAAWDDEPWVVEGAMVHVSIVGFDNGAEKDRTLDGTAVPSINADLTAGLDVTRAKRLRENSDVAFQGPVKVGKFEITSDVADSMLLSKNPNGKPNSDIVVPWMNGADLIEHPPRHMFIIDFPESLPEHEAALYEAPFEYVKRVVKPERDTNRSESRKRNWWRLGASGRHMRTALTGLDRYLATARVSKHRIFVWVEAATLPDTQVVVFAFDDDFKFGVLQAKPHGIWSLRKGSQVRERESGFRYTPESVFETYPFPKCTPEQAAATAVEARALDELRRNWLAVEPDKRALTELYNEWPTWLEKAHERLDRAVYAAYGWEFPLSEEEILAHLITLNAARAAETGVIEARSTPTKHRRK
ncbi:MAG TPA: DNA methyltransferase [Candidatus Baltobacterales bacterium]|nr:DNA methyltransferase [Candidatus Baltobacterales bacterium]